MALARRCSICAIDWPDDSKHYKQCPECLEKTDRIRNADPLDSDEARSQRLHAEFERFYEDEWPDLRPDEDPEDAPQTSSAA